MAQGTVRKNDRPPLERHYFSEREVFAYIRELLAWRDVMSAELRCLPIESGSVFAFLPVGFQLRQPSDLRWDSEHFRGRRVEMIRSVIGFVFDYLEEDSSRLALFASSWREGDPVVARLSTPYVLVPDVAGTHRGLWHLLSRREAASYNVVEDAFHEGRPFTFLASLTKLPVGSAGFQPRQEISEEAAKAMARDTDHLVVEAFDGMAHLIWSRMSGVAV